MHACEADPRWALEEYLRASAYPVHETAGQWPIEAKEEADRETAAKASALLTEAAALLKKDKRKGARKK